MSFNISISGRVGRERGGVSLGDPLTLEEGILDGVEELMQLIRAMGHEVTFAHFGAAHLDADLVQGTRVEREPDPSVEAIPEPQRGPDVVAGVGSSPADPSAPVSQEDGITGVVPQ